MDPVDRILAARKSISRAVSFRADGVAVRVAHVSAIGLAIALVGSNLWWGYRALDFGLSSTHQEVELEHTKEALSQMRAVLVAVADGTETRGEVLEAARSGAFASDPVQFEKEGYVWIGRIGLAFNADGRLVGVADRF